MKEYRKHIKLLKEIRHLAWKIKGTRSISTHERETAINNTLMALLKKEEEGILELNSYENYKGYMFLTIRNYIYRLHEHKQTQIYSFHNDFFEETNEKDIIDEQESYKDFLNKEEIDAKIKRLPDFDRALLRWTMRGWSQLYLSEATGIPRTTLGARLLKIKKALK